MNNSKHKIKIEDILVAHPKKALKWHGKHPSIEDTGLGNTLCFEKWGGRFFFSDEGAVQEAVDKFVEDYTNACEMTENDPTGVNVEVFNFNDMYCLLHIVSTPFGAAWGYNTSRDYARPIEYKVHYVNPTEDEIANKFGCRILVIEPFDDDSYPDYYYRECIDVERRDAHE